VLLALRTKLHEEYSYFTTLRRQQQQQQHLYDR